MHCESHPHAYRQSSRRFDRLTTHVTGHDFDIARIGAVDFSSFPGGPALLDEET